MDTVVGNGAGAANLDIEGTLFRAALLARHGSEARHLAARLASVCGAVQGRSCVEAGSPVQFTVDAPGEVELRVGLRLGATLQAETLDQLVPTHGSQRLCGTFSRLSTAHPRSLGFWLFWSRRRQSIFTDLRDADIAQAIERLRLVLDGEEQRRLNSVLAMAAFGRPWGVRVEIGANDLRRVQLYWLVTRSAEAAQMVDAFAPGQWSEVVDVLRMLLNRPGESGRWMLAIPLDADPGGGGIAVGNSAWALVPEDEKKHRAVGQAVGALGGARDYAEALWSFCRGAAGPGWRVGRTCEVGLGAGVPRLRLYFSPQVEPEAASTTAGISSSDSVESSTAPVEADPLSE